MRATAGKLEQDVIKILAQENLSGISVMVMAYDEVESVEAVVKDISAELRKLRRPAEIVVIDDGSHDGTGELSERLHSEYPLLRVVHHSENLGLGGVYRTGFREAKQDFITFFPADGQFPADILGRFLPLMDEADMVLGYLPERRNSPGKILSWLERQFYAALFGGFPRFQGIMMFRRNILDAVPLQSKGRGWTVVMELILRARDAGFRLHSEPTGIRSRQRGHSKVNNLKTICANTLQMIQLRQLLTKGK